RVSKGWGSLGLWVESIEPVGEGSLKKAYELLVKKLTAEGLFARKRGLPEFISRIGVISSRDGVVLQDLRKNLAKLGMSIKFVHTQVEGAGAVPGILRALDYFHQSTSDFDVLVVIRGGGSLESLQAFNNEEVARALFSLPIPVIAGIGHDVDVPIAALVADAEGSTPTAVAHIINDTWSALVVGLPQLERDLERGMQNLISGIKQKVALLEQKMFSYFTRIFRSFDQMLARLSRGTNAIGVRLKLIREQIGRAEGLFAIADPMRNLRLGYSITMVGGKVVKKRGDVNMGDTLETRFSDGSIETKVTKK
ncbi:MAG TPA: exodeoxyribonuclease VII large subunit, partial [Candidatus Paceibacterota bacterium]